LPWLPETVFLGSQALTRGSAAGPDRFGENAPGDFPGPLGLERKDIDTPPDSIVHVNENDRNTSSLATPLTKNTFEAAAAANAHLIVQIKDNQPTLYREVEAVCATAEPLSRETSIDKNRRNRHETRAVAMFEAKPAVAETEWELRPLGVRYPGSCARRFRLRRPRGRDVRW